jgi:hypothetical protein
MPSIHVTGKLNKGWFYILFIANNMVLKGK